MAGGPSADKSRESGVIREIDGGGGARAASQRCMPDQTSDNCGDAGRDWIKNFKNRFITRCVIPPQGRDDYLACRFILAQHSAGWFVIIIILSF